MKYKLHIQRLGVLLSLLLSSIFTYAQLTVKEGDTVKLSVNEVLGETYVWELYEVSENIDFAKIEGNCPKSKAYFVNNKNTGSTVQVKWLVEGEYFYKVTANNSCTNNIKIGWAVVSRANMQKPPKIVVDYDCDKASAILTASDYTGSLLWSTGETSESIEVFETGTYTLIQTVDNKNSKTAKVEITELAILPPTRVTAIPPKIEEGETAKLSADVVESNVLHWYLDEGLKEELDSPFVTPENTTVYWAVAESKAGCQSRAVPFILVVEKFDVKRCQKMYKAIKVPQFVSPNGDGVNDTWDLSSLLKYCSKCKKDAVVHLFNRWGAKVYEATSASLQTEFFRGYSNNELDFYEHLLPEGVYFYVILVDGTQKRSGYIYLLRN